MSTSKGTRLGGQQVVESGKLSEIINWKGVDNEIFLMTITAQCIERVPFFRPYASVKWGCKGCIITADVDIGHGLQIPLHGSSIAVSVGGDPVPGNQTKQKICAMLSFFSCNQTYFTRTRYIDSLGPNPVEVSIPAFSYNVTLNRGASAKLVPLRVSFINAQDEVLYEYRTDASDRLLKPVIVSADAYKMRIVNLGQATVDLQAVFSLAF